MEYNDEYLEIIITVIIDSIQSKELDPVEAATVLVDLGFDIEDATDIVVSIMEQSGMSLVENSVTDKSRADAVRVSDRIIHHIEDDFKLSSAAVQKLREEGQPIMIDILEECYNKKKEVDETVKEITTIAYEYDDSKTITDEWKKKFVDELTKYAEDPKNANPADASALNL